MDYKVIYDPDNRGLGHFVIKTSTDRGWFINLFIPKWVKTHRCNSLEEAINIIGYLKNQYSYKKGEILYCI